MSLCRGFVSRNVVRFVSSSSFGGGAGGGSKGAAAAAAAAAATAASAAAAAAVAASAAANVAPEVKPRMRVSAAALRQQRTQGWMHRVYSAAKLPLQPVTLSDMLRHGATLNETTLIQSASWLHNELPRRIAGQLLAVQKFPFGLGQMPSARAMREDYMRSFIELTDLALPTTMEETAAYTERLERVYARHNGILVQLAKAIYELEESMASTVSDDDLSAFTEFANLNEPLDHFFTRRIGIRLLIGQHLANFADFKNGRREGNIVGLIDRELSPMDVAHDATSVAMGMCRDATGMAPEVIVEGPKLTFPYLREHLFYILLELLKNACRATVETHGDAPSLPPVRIVIADSDENEDVAIKISDLGGGIRRSNMDRVWSYLFTTALVDTRALVDGTSIGVPMAGFGVGLPVSRAHARYFGGDLHIISMYGHGTDCALYLRRLGDVKEPLPV
jgi:pyruvate dehydrogenase kinase 2/3/4